MPPEPGLTEARIRQLLTHCYDPRIPLNIVDLGLVHAVTVEVDPDAPGAGIPGVPPRHRVAIELIPANTSEAGQAQLRAQVENLLAGIPEVWHASVTLVDEHGWTPARISAAGRRQLQIEPPPFPILNNRVR